MISSASGTASSVLRVRAFIEMHLQPVEDRAPPDAAIPRPQHPVSFVREVQEFRVESHPFSRRERLIPLREIHPIIDRKSTRLNSSHSQISYAVFCLKKKKNRCSSTCR